MRGINHSEDFGWAAALRGGGKGGKSTPVPAPPPTYTDPVTGMVFNDPASLNAEIQQRQADAATKSASDQATAQQQAAQNEADFQTRKSGAYNTALQDAMAAFTKAGVDPNAYRAQYIDPSLQRAGQTIQDLDPNPTATYDPEGYGQSLVNQATSDRRTQLTNALNSVFTPNYATNAISSSIATPYYSQILDEQFNPMVQALQNAQKRGQLTDQGYGAAMDALNQKRSAGQSQLETLGSNILAQDRSGLNDLISGARSDINAAGLSSNIDPSSYWSQANQKAQDYTSGFGGALRSAVGGTQFANLNDLLNAGGLVQGASNSTTGAQTPMLPGGAASADPNDPNAKRGLGSVGAF